MMLSALMLFGFFGLLGRLWLVERRIAPYLAEDKAHISRIVGYFFWSAMFLGFKVNVLTFISVAIFPGMLFAIFLFDLPFFAKDFPKIPKEHPKFWILIERLTLHLPLAIYGLMFYFTGTKLVYYFALFSPPLVVGGVIVVFGLFLLIDPRWTIKKDHPRGNIILIMMIIGLIGNIIVYLLFAVPRGQVQFY